MTLNRRRLLAAAGAAALAPGLLGRALAGPQGSGKKVLFFTKSAGFQHGPITRKGDQLGLAERVLIDVGKSNNFEVVASKDGRMFDPDQIGQFDAFVFYTTGDLTKEGTDKQPPMSPEGEKALYEAVRSGKGFMGMHSATDTFGHHRDRGADDPYIQLIGGEFSGHGPQQEATIRVADPTFPGVPAFGVEKFSLNDEWYGQMNLADDLHVILVQETEGMQGNDYARPPYPMTWSRKHGQGRVLYTAMGHREDVWENPKYQSLLAAGLGFITGKIEGSTEADVATVTPKYKDVPKKEAAKKKA